MPETTARRSIQGPATANTVEDLHTELDDLWNEVGHVPDTDQKAFTLAVVEATTNAVLHAVPAGENPVQLTIDITAEPDRLEAKIYEIGAAPAHVDLDATMPGRDSESGRGIALIQALVNTICFERDGNTNIWSLRRDCLSTQPQKPRRNAAI